MNKTGSCLCGSVQYEIADAPSEASACHCSMCQKWTGGINIAFQVPAQNVTLNGVENITRYKSSDWAERAFCKTCGSNLFYRITAPGPHEGQYHIGMGTLDDSNGMAMNTEIFIDEKPDSYNLAGDTHKMTGAEVSHYLRPRNSCGLNFGSQWKSPQFLTNIGWMPTHHLRSEGLYNRCVQRVRCVHSAPC